MELYRVILSKSARKDLRDTANYIATQLFAPIAASRKVKRIRETIYKNLSFMPQKYRLVDNKRLAAMGFRRVNVENYIIFFVVDEEKHIVTVRRIIHGARDWKRVLSAET